VAGGGAYGERGGPALAVVATTMVVLEVVVGAVPLAVASSTRSRSVA
jgi:hypothetical protein